jgi:hypothetical protein
MNLTIYKALQDAYEALTSPQRMEWRKREGHEEFCRLQRLSFHAFI